MSNPQPPDPASDLPAGRVPVHNQPGHHPAAEQDKPDLDAFAAKLGVVEAPEEGDAGGWQAGPAGRDVTAAAVAGAVAAVLAVVLAVLAGRRRRSRR